MTKTVSVRVRLRLQVVFSMELQPLVLIFCVSPARFGDMMVDNASVKSVMALHQ